VEDDEPLRSVLRQILERTGHEVAEAADGRAAMEIQRQKGADLVITDIIMPEVDGIETIMVLRREFPSVKIIAISGAAASVPGSS
jgi:CheY-like chemotaxis protein